MEVKQKTNSLTSSIFLNNKMIPLLFICLMMPSLAPIEPPRTLRLQVSFHAIVPISVLTFADTVVDNVKARIVSLEVEIDDKAKTIEIMKNTIKQMRTKEQETSTEQYVNTNYKTKQKQNKTKTKQNTNSFSVHRSGKTS
jgi:hypothetical protein